MLLTLVIVSILATVSIIGMQSTIQNTRLVQSYHSYDLAVQRAETAIVLGEKALNIEDFFTVNVQSKLIENKGMYAQSVVTNSGLETAWRFIDQQNLWADSNYAVVQRIAGYISSYIIEELRMTEPLSEVLYFRVTANGQGFEKNTTVILQTIVRIEKFPTGIEKNRVSWLKIQ
ncbi:MAG: hypothetical protein V7784_13405 [Oceanospirillaceae bacterium]